MHAVVARTCTSTASTPLPSTSMALVSVAEPRAAGRRHARRGCPYGRDGETVATLVHRRRRRGPARALGHELLAVAGAAAAVAAHAHPQGLLGLPRPDAGSVTTAGRSSDLQCGAGAAWHRVVLPDVPADRGLLRLHRVPGTPGHVLPARPWASGGWRDGHGAVRARRPAVATASVAPAVAPVAALAAHASQPPTDEPSRTVRRRRPRPLLAAAEPPHPPVSTRRGRQRRRARHRTRPCPTPAARPAAPTAGSTCTLARCWQLPLVIGRGPGLAIQPHGRRCRQGWPARPSTTSVLQHLTRAVAVRQQLSDSVMVPEARTLATLGGDAAASAQSAPSAVAPAAARASAVAPATRPDSCRRSSAVAAATGAAAAVAASAESASATFATLLPTRAAGQLSARPTISAAVRPTPPNNPPSTPPLPPPSPPSPPATTNLAVQQPQPSAAASRRQEPPPSEPPPSPPPPVSPTDAPAHTASAVAPSAWAATSGRAAADAAHAAATAAHNHHGRGFGVRRRGAGGHGTRPVPTGHGTGTRASSTRTPAPTHTLVPRGPLWCRLSTCQWWTRATARSRPPSPPCWREGCGT